MQVMRNLVSNAIKVSPEGGSIFIEISELEDEDAAVVSVADQGPGGRRP